MHRLIFFSCSLQIAYPFQDKGIPLKNVKGFFEKCIKKNVVLFAYVKIKLNQVFPDKIKFAGVNLVSELSCNKISVCKLKPGAKTFTVSQSH